MDDKRVIASGLLICLCFTDKQTADDEGTVDEGGAAGGEPLGEDPQVATVADVHRSPDDDDYPLDVAVEEEVTTQDEDKEKEDVEDDEEDEEDEEEDEEDDEEDDEELDEMIKVNNVQAGNVA